MNTLSPAELRLGDNVTDAEFWGRYRPQATELCGGDTGGAGQSQADCVTGAGASEVAGDGGEPCQDGVAQP